MSISTSIQLQIEGKMFVVEMINASIADNVATTLSMNPTPSLRRNPPVGVFMQNAHVPGKSARTPVGPSNDYVDVPFTYTVTGGKVVVTVQFANGGTYMCRFGIMYQK